MRALFSAKQNKFWEAKLVQHEVLIYTDMPLRNEQIYRAISLLDITVNKISFLMVDPKVIFTIALKCNASALILAHNHQSGNLQPSEADRVTTRKLVEGGKLLDIAVCDHLIISNDGFNSFDDNGLI